MIKDFASLKEAIEARDKLSESITGFIYDVSEDAKDDELINWFGYIDDICVHDNWLEIIDNDHGIDVSVPAILFDDYEAGKAKILAEREQARLDKIAAEEAKEAEWAAKKAESERQLYEQLKEKYEPKEKTSDINDVILPGQPIPDDVLVVRDREFDRWHRKNRAWSVPCDDNFCDNPHYGNPMSYAPLTVLERKNG